MFKVGDVVRAREGISDRWYIDTAHSLPSTPSDIGFVEAFEEHTDEVDRWRIRWVRTGAVTGWWSVRELEKVGDTD